MAIDVVHDLQEVYRQVLQTMARPGYIENIKEITNKNTYDCDSYQETLVMAMMLLDGEVSFHVAGEEKSELEKQIAVLTLAEQKDQIDADYIFIKNDVDIETIKSVIRQAKVGTLENPQNSATIIMEMKQVLNNEGPFSLSGPGIEHTMPLFIAEGNNWLVDRTYVNREFPLGVDFILVDKEGNIVSLPRTTFVENKEV